MTIKELQFEEAVLRERLRENTTYLKKYTELAEEYSYITHLIQKDRQEQRERLEEIKKAITKGGE